MFGTVNMYPLTDAPVRGKSSINMQSYKERALMSASSSELYNSHVRPGTLSRTHSESTTSSFGWETVRDIQKTYELIRFAGCETHHDMLVALRMLLPYQRILSDHETGHDDNTTEKDMIRVRIEGGHPILYKTADALTLEKTLSDILDTYIAAKLSRRKKAKKPEQGRTEVGGKLKVLEQEFSDNIVMLRVFDLARLRHRLPARDHGVRSIHHEPQPLPLSSGSMLPLNMEPSLDERPESPSRRKPKMGSFSRQGDGATKANSDPIRQDGVNTGQQNMHLYNASYTSPKYIVRQPDVPNWSDPGNTQGHATCRQADCSSDSSTVPSRNSTLRSHNPAPISLMALDPVDTGASPQADGVRMRNAWHGTHPSTKTHSLFERHRWKGRSGTAGGPRASVGLNKMHREFPLHLDSDDDIADQLFWKSDVKKDEAVTLPVINYSHPRGATLKRSDSSDLHLTTISDVARPGSAELPTKYRSEPINAAHSCATLPRETLHAKDTCSSSPVNWELSAFEDEIVEEITRMPRPRDDITLHSGGDIERCTPHDISTRKVENGNFNAGMAHMGNARAELQNRSARRESVVWNVY